MKLESLKSEKFRKLENDQLSKVTGGNVNEMSSLTDSASTFTWTKAEKKTDDDCSDCDEVVGG